MKILILAAGIALASCTTTATCLNAHGHHPHDHHPECAPTERQVNDSNPTPPVTPPEPTGPPNNGWGNGDQNAPGSSLENNGAENEQ